MSVPTGMYPAGLLHKYTFRYYTQQSYNTTAILYCMGAIE